MRLLSWYRPAVTGALVRATITAAILVTGGMSLLGFGFWGAHVGADVRPLLLVAGGLSLLAGTLGFVWRLARLMWTEDAYLGLRDDGVDVHLGAAPCFLPWSEVASVSLDAAGAIEIRRAAGDPVRITCELGGVSHVDLVRELEQMRRRAAMGMLR